MNFEAYDMKAEIMFQENKQMNFSGETVYTANHGNTIIINQHNAGANIIRDIKP